MVEIEFTYNSLPTVIQCQKDEYMKDICQRFSNKVRIELSKVYFLYRGQTLDINQAFNKILKEDDKNSNRINLLVYSYDNNNLNNNFENSKEIICSKCGNICLINFNEYKINISGCKNNHSINGISLNEFQNFQKIDISKIICNDCKNNNKKTSYNFYKCLTCKKDLCSLCKDKAHKEHDSIEYDKLNYICNLHNEPFSSFCKKCNQNICMFCESEHKDKENIIYYRDILPKKDVMKNQIEELKNIINQFKEKIQDIKNIFDMINTNLEIYVNINDKMIKNFEKKNRNFQLFNNMKEIINNNINILKELNEIKNESDKIKFFSNAFKIYEKMNDKNILNNYSSNKKEKINIENKIVQTQASQTFREKKLNDKIEMNNTNTYKNHNANKKNENTQKYSKNIYCSMVAEQANRYSEMCNFLEKEYKKRFTDFNSEERNLLSNAYKNLISNQRSSLRIINAYEKKEKKKDKSVFLPYIIEYKKKVFDELKTNCKRVINFIDEYLLKRAKDNEAYVFYYRLKGDYYRYISEFAEGNFKIQTKDSASKAFNKAIKISSKLHILNPNRLGLLLNYSLFQNDILKDHKKAIEISKNAINKVDKELPGIDKNADENSDAIKIYELLKENLNMWESEEK